ncbi:MAG: SgcJ/EcaC family oxidoreductase [Thermoanaerobaculia bacterium]
MKKILLGGMVLALAATTAVSAQIPALHARAEEFKAAWDHADAKALAALWTPNGDLINPFGRVAKGRAEIEKLFHDELNSLTKGTTFNIGSDSAREIAPDVAVADWDVEIAGMKGPDGAAMPPLKHHVTVVWVKRDGKWWAAAARPVVYPPPPGGPK